jgi:hypothetical protein
MRTMRVWTLVVQSADSQFIGVTVHPDEEDARTHLRVNYDPEDEWELDLDSEHEVARFADYFNLYVEIDSHLVEVPS